MGCGTSNDVKTYERADQTIWRGNLTVHLRKAQIKKDFQLLGKMDPYVKFKMGNQMQTSEVCTDGGQFPTWKQSFNFQRKNENDVVYIQVWNKNAIQADDFIGEGGFSLCKVRKGTQGKVDTTCTIFGKREQIGEVELQLEFQLDPASKNHPEVQAPDVTGQVIVRPKTALLQRDTTFLFGSMNPTALVRLGDDYQVSGAHMEGGKQPKWSDQLVFTRDTVARDTFTIEVQNFSESGDNDLIGVGFLSITPSLVPDSKPTKSVELYFEGNVVGNIQLEMEYIPDNTQETQNLLQKAKSFAQSIFPGQNQQQQQPVQQQYVPPAQPQAGTAEFRYPNGDYYNGEWVNGLKQGNGKMVYRSGMTYEGQWMNDLFHGQGTLSVAGTTYTGQFLNGKKNGQGTIVWHNSQQKYEGEWQNNNYHGVGFWTHPNGQKQKGEFQNGNRTRWLDDQPKNFMPAGRCLMQGNSMPSDNNMYTLFLAYNGCIQVVNNQTRGIDFQISNFQQMPQAPFYLRLENHGQLNAIDGTGRVYYCSQPPQMGSQGPFKLVMQNDGKIAVHDANQAIWLSH